MVEWKFQMDFLGTFLQKKYEGMVLYLDKNHLNLKKLAYILVIQS
jgi:hypothetical protein